MSNEYIKCIDTLRNFKTFSGKPTNQRFDRIGENLYDNKLQKILSKDDASKLTREETKILRNKSFELSEKAKSFSGEEQCKLLEKVFEIKDKIYVRDFYKFRKIEL